MHSAVHLLDLQTPNCISHTSESQLLPLGLASVLVNTSLKSNFQLIGSRSLLVEELNHVKSIGSKTWGNPATPQNLCNFQKLQYVDCHGLPAYSNEPQYLLIGTHQELQTFFKTCIAVHKTSSSNKNTKCQTSFKDPFCIPRAAQFVGL